MAQRTLTLTKTPESDLATKLSSIAERLEAAANIRISHTDSDSRVASLNEQRTATMRQLAAELRALS